MNRDTPPEKPRDKTRDRTRDRRRDKAHAKAPPPGLRAPRVAVVGRPNVGKSTLFNRLAGRRLALVDDQPGVTRDRKEAQGRLGGLDITLIDTAGFEDARGESLEAKMRRQTELAVAQADVILFVIDARAGVTPLDETFADVVRRAGGQVICVANKAEGKAGRPGIGEAYALGLGEPVAVSAEHGEGLFDLEAALRAALELTPWASERDRLLAELELKAQPEPDGPSGEPMGEPLGEPMGEDAGDRAGENRRETGEDRRETGEDRRERAVHDDDQPQTAETSADGLDGALDEDADQAALRPMRIAVLGRPNAGKSTLVNALLQEERLITGPEAGVTRDAISVDWEWEGRRVELVDTAGLRKRAKVDKGLERLAVGDALRAVKFADVVLIVMDEANAFDAQDLKLADLAFSEGRALVLVIAKWDQTDEPQDRLREMKEKAERLLPQCKGAPVIALSAQTGRHLDKLMPAVAKLYDDWNARVKTPDLNQWLSEMTSRHPPPAVGGRRIRLKYMTQTKARPPTFVLMASRADKLPDAYKRYLINGLREAFDLPGVPIRLHVRGGKNPYADKG